MHLIEVQIDRLVGPTHHFGGLGVGNVASATHAGEESNPAAAAIQGLNKMRLIAGFGVPQFILPPQRRPNRRFLQDLGFGEPSGLGNALRESPQLLSAAMSSSAMWTANAATVSPASDSGNSVAKITVANLIGSLHRAMEPAETEADLAQLLSNVADIAPPLPGGVAMRDEGAANHMRLAGADDRSGIHVFVYGDGEPQPQVYWPRQTRAASQAVARTLRLDPSRTCFLKQSRRAIDAGAFHNDVVAASHQNLLLYHESAFEEPDSLDQVEQRYRDVCGRELRRFCVRESELSLQDAIATYLFNSQIISTADQHESPVLICPAQVRDHPGAARVVAAWQTQQLFSQVCFVELGQSMSGGGGPACLRLRVPLTVDQIARIPTQARWSESLDAELRDLIQETYPTRLELADLADNALAEQAERTRQRIAKILQAN